MVTNTMSVRRVARAQRLTEELGHTDILEALLHAEEMRTALRVIYTWAGVDGALDPDHVRDLAGRALGLTHNAENEPTP